MQNRYFGDIGDFAKYGLLRAICPDEPEWRLCVLWYLVPDESHTNDGRHVAYLKPTAKNLKAFRACDSELFDGLGRLVGAGTRSVSAVAENGLLPRQTLYHDEPLSYRGIRNVDREAHRERWLATAHKVASEAAIVFLDPDNGLEVGTDRHKREGPKFAFYDDLAPLSQAGKTVVIYQHANRAGSFSDQIQGRLSALRSGLGRPVGNLFALRWRRLSPRAFIFALGDGHLVLHDRLRGLLAGAWGTHFELVHLTS